MIIRAEDGLESINSPLPNAATLKIEDVKINEDGGRLVVHDV